MRITDWLLRCVALVLTFSMVLATTPVSAADLVGPNTVLGSVSGSGSVQVRGVALQKEATLFSGDRVRTGPGAYVKISLANGTRIEVAGNTEFIVKSDGEKGVRLNLVAGSIAFTSSKNPLTVAMNGHEVHPKAGSNVNIGFLPGAEMADVRVLSGSVELENLASKGKVAIAAGSERIVNFKTGKIDDPVVKVVTTGSPAVPPAGAPAAPPLKMGSSVVALIGTLAGAAAAIAVLSTRPVVSDINASQRIEQQQAIQDTQNLISATTEAFAAATQVGISASLIASIAPADAAEANALVNAANTTKGEITTLNAQLATLASQLVAVTDPAQLDLLQSQVNNLRNQVESKVATLNSQIDQLSALAKKTGSTVTIPDQVDVEDPVASGSNP